MARRALWARTQRIRRVQGRREKATRLARLRALHEASKETSEWGSAVGRHLRPFAAMQSVWSLGSPARM
jgi:hypothetical protein